MKMMRIKISRFFIVYNIEVISDRIFQLLFSDILANVFDEVLFIRRKRFDLKKTLTNEKSKK